MVGDAQRLRKAEPVNQPYIMLDWSRGWAAVPKTVVDGFESCIEHRATKAEVKKTISYKFSLVCNYYQSDQRCQI